MEWTRTASASMVAIPTGRNQSAADTRSQRDDANEGERTVGKRTTKEKGRQAMLTDAAKVVVWPGARKRAQVQRL